MLIYDIEIEKAVPSGLEPKPPDIEYCEGWDDKENMGVACICAYDLIDDRYRVFTAGTFKDFERLAAERFVIGFNSIAFDDVVCGHQGIKVRTDWDLLAEMWAAAGFTREFTSEKNKGYGLDATAKANGLTGKTGYGGTAPIDWQRGLYGSVIDYCLEDVRLTWTLVRQVIEHGMLCNPKDTGWLRPVPDSAMLRLFRQYPRP